MATLLRVHGLRSGLGNVKNKERFGLTTESLISYTYYLSLQPTIVYSCVRTALNPT